MPLAKWAVTVMQRSPPRCMMRLSLHFGSTFAIWRSGTVVFVPSVAAAKAYDEANRRAGSAGDNLMILLETRLDALVYRMGFARTIFAARQYVAHGHFTVNGVRSYSPSRQIKAGDVIAVREGSKEHVQIKEAIANAPAAPEYLTVDAGKMEGSLVKLPLRDQIPVKLEEQLVVEYYSR